MDEKEKKNSTSVAQRLAKARSLLPAIGKNHKNSNQGWKYRGIDDVQNVLGKALEESGLVLLPSYKIMAHIPNDGGKGFTVFLEATYDFLSTDDPNERASCVFVGQGTDPGDKAVGKAKAVCFKYMAFQTFQIPVEAGVLDDNDRDSPVAETSKQDRKWR